MKLAPPDLANKSMDALEEGPEGFYGSHLDSMCQTVVITMTPRRGQARVYEG